jgi:hypothetical protein
MLPKINMMSTTVILSGTSAQYVAAADVSPAHIRTGGTFVHEA